MLFPSNPLASPMLRAASSLSIMVPVARSWASCTSGGFRLLRMTVKVSSGSSISSLIVGTLMVFCVCPGENVRVGVAGAAV